MPWLPALYERLRQYRFPPEFRITEPTETRPAQPPAQPQPADESTVEEPVPDAAPSDDLPDGVLADVATNLWRTRRKLTQSDDEGQSRAQRQAHRHLLAAWETFTQAGLEIHDFDGTRFDAGMSLEVLAYEARPDVTGETVLETIRPAVYRQGRCIQLGQVIVAQPEKGRSNGA